MLVRVTLALLICLFGVTAYAQTQQRQPDPSAVYHKAWRLVNEVYIDQTFNGQDWSNWEHKYDGKLTSQEDAYAAIHTMLASLSQPQLEFFARGTVDTEKSSASTKTKPDRPVVSTQMLPDNIGYLRIDNVRLGSTTSAVANGLKELGATKALILDLRGNTGGAVSNAVNIADMFLKTGTVLSTVDSEHYKTVQTCKPEDCLYSNAVMLLLDHDTANGAEIIAAALHDNARATLVGTRSNGANRVIAVNVFEDGSYLSVPVALWLTPNGQDIFNHGIEPDCVVEIKKNDGDAWWKRSAQLDPKTLNNDVQLLKAFSMLNTKSAK